LFQVPAGMLADRWGAGRVLFVAGFWWAATTLLIAGLGWGPLRSHWLSPLWILIILRFILGVGEAPTYPAAAQGVARWIPPVRQGLASGIVLASIGLGSGLASPFMSIVMVRWGWHAALLASAVPAVLVAIAWMSIRESCEHVTSHSPKPTRAPNRRALWSRSFVLLTASYTLEGYVGYVFIFWFYLYLVQERHFDLLRAGRFGSLPWILSLITIPLGGIVSDRLVSGPLGMRWGRRVIPMAGLSFAGVFLILGARTQSGYVAALFL